MVTAFMVSLTVLGKGCDARYTDLQAFPTIQTLVKYCREFYEDIVDDPYNPDVDVRRIPWSEREEVEDAMSELLHLYIEVANAATEDKLIIYLNYMKHTLWILCKYVFIYQVSQLDIDDDDSHRCNVSFLASDSIPPRK